MYNDDYIANRINELCEKQGISRYQLSKQCGLSESSISNLINRKSDPQCSTISKICDGFGITMSQFFADSDYCYSLTKDQFAILELWQSLSDIEKRLVEAYIRGIKKK